MAITYNNEAFIAAHPNLAAVVAAKHGGLDWIKKYTDEKNGRLVEAWERNSEGELVNVTEREKAREELNRAREELDKLTSGGK